MVSLDDSMVFDCIFLKGPLALIAAVARLSSPSFYNDFYDGIEVFDANPFEFSPLKPAVVDEAVS